MKEFLEYIFRFSVVIFVVVSMVDMGLRLTVRQILAPLKNGRLVALALVANFVMVPAFIYLMLTVIPVNSAERTGLILLSVAAGAPFLPKLTEIAKNDIAYSIGLMLLLMLFTVFYMPLVLPFMMPGTVVHSWEIGRSLVTLMLFPLIIALFVKEYFAKVTTFLLPVAKWTSDIALITLTVSLIAINYKKFQSMTWANILAILLSLIGATVIGYLFGGADKNKRIVMSLGTGQRNIAAALLVASGNFPDPQVVLTLIGISVFGLLLMVPYAQWLRKWKGNR